MDTKIRTNISPCEDLDTITRDKKWDAMKKYPHEVDDYYHKNQGPWPQPAPDNPVMQMAEVIHLPKEELKDWKKNVGRMYFWRVVTRWPWGLWYAFTHKHYKPMDDEQFRKEITLGLYSKFITPLDNGDRELFKEHLPKLADGDNVGNYVKADFSCMEPIAPNCRKGMYAAPSITLISKNKNGEYEPLAIYLYQVNENEDKQTKKFTYTPTVETIFTPEDGEKWHLAKYFVLQGAVHRVNLTEHALLHFPFDCINAITKSILPTNHLLFQLLIPHFRLSLGVNRAVLENPGSLINRGKHKFYSPFCAEGKHIRQLLPDGYIGRGEAKEKSYPEYSFPLEPKIPDSDYGKYLKAYYDVFAKFVPKVLEQIDDEDEESWLYIALWAECIREWMPGFPTKECLTTCVSGKTKPTKQGREILEKVVTMIMWDLSIAHATDHIAIHKKEPHGNPFRLRVPPPCNKKEPEKNWRNKLIKRLDLLTFWFTDLLFYLPHNVTLLQDVDYEFSLPKKEAEKEKLLKLENEQFKKALRDCETTLKRDKIDIPARLKQISTSLQY